MIKLTHHVKIRYIQRVIGIADELEAELYLKENEAQVCFEIWTMHSKSRMIYENYLYDEIKDITGNVLLFDNFILIEGENGDNLVTLWKTNYADVMGETTTEEHLRKIRHYASVIIERKNDSKKRGEECNSVEYAIEVLEEQVRLLKEKCEDIKKGFNDRAIETKEIKRETKKMIKELLSGVRI